MVSMFGRLAIRAANSRVVPVCEKNTTVLFPVEFDVPVLGGACEHPAASAASMPRAATFMNVLRAAVGSSVPFLPSAIRRRAVQRRGAEDFAHVHAGRGDAGRLHCHLPPAGAVNARRRVRCRTLARCRCGDSRFPLLGAPRRPRRRRQAMCRRSGSTLRPRCWACMILAKLCVPPSGNGAMPVFDGAGWPQMTLRQ